MFNVTQKFAVYNMIGNELPCPACLTKLLLVECVVHCEMLWCWQWACTYASRYTVGFIQCWLIPPSFIHTCIAVTFYRAMHFSAKRGIAIACRLSVRLSVTLVDCDHIRWNSSKIIPPLVSLGCSLFATLTWRVCSKGNTPKFGHKVTHPLLIWASETLDRKLRLNGYR